MVLGTALGLGTAWLLRTIDNYQVEVLITLAVVAGGTALAARLHTSGPLAMVMAGLLVGHFSRAGALMSDESQDYVDKFWELIDEVLNALLFVLMGLEILVLHIPGAMLLAGRGGHWGGAGGAGGGRGRAAGLAARGPSTVRCRGAALRCSPGAGCAAAWPWRWP